MSRLLLQIFLAVVLFSSSFAAQLPLAVGTSNSRASIDTNFGNAQSNFTELFQQVTTVVPVIGVSAAADTAAINAALSGGNKHVVIKGTATINSKLIIYSNTNFEITPGSVLKYADGTANQSEPMIVNYSSVSPQRTITYSGTIAGGATTITDASITSADVGRSIYIPLARSTTGIPTEKFLFCSKIISVDGTTATFEKPTMVDAVNPAVVIYNRDTNIRVFGGGEINRNTVAGDTSNGLVTFFFRHLDNVIFENLRLITASSVCKYALNLADIRGVTVRNIYFDTYSDGVHFLGESYDISISKIRGKTGDDIAAFTGLDYAEGADTIGDIENVVIDDIVSNQVVDSRPVLLLGGAGTVLKNFTISNIRGTMLNGISIIEDVLNGSSLTYVRDIHIKNVSIHSPKSIVFTAADPRSTVFIDGVALSYDGVSQIYIEGKADIIELSGVSASNLAAVTSRYQLIKFASASDISNLVIKNTIIALGSGKKFNTLFSFEGSITNMMVDGFDFYSPSYLGGYNDIFTILPTAIIGRISLNNIVFVNGHTLLYAQAGSTLGYVNLAGFNFSGCARIAEFATPAVVNVGAGITKSFLAEEFNLGTGGTLVLTGEGNFSYAATVGRDATQSIRINNHKAKIDVSKLTPSNGDVAFNTNAALGTLGVAGPVIYSTGTGWHLMADTTKVYAP